ncbi:MAG: helix-turn-helix transcriptional regulator [Niastella sp.]|nr:helix-turn-helix transcriptional regulator [Niastella sp.]
MDHQSKYLTPEIKISCYEDKLSRTEIVFDHHMLIWFIAGETRIIQADACHVFRSGDIFLIPRNQPATIVNYPTNNQPHRTVVMHLSPARLRAFYEGVPARTPAGRPGGIRTFGNHPLLRSCFASLMPYFELNKLPEEVANIKITEAISILRLIDSDIDSVLADFELPGKIDLVGFMERNYMFNMPIERFGYLTGRSLATFKRDFKKAFQTTPQRWLTKKRLELAYYNFKEKQLKPVDVYFAVGFENLSHFSYAFKKHFGYNPTDLLANSAVL